MILDPHSTTAFVIDGKKQAKLIEEDVARKVQYLKDRHHIIPGLAVILVGNNPASELYVGRKMELAKKLGMLSFKFIFESGITSRNLIMKIQQLNNDPKVHGILVQLPLPKHINTDEIVNAINPAKDVDGFHPINIGKLCIEQRTGLIPCTPKGCLILIRTVLDNLDGKRAVVIGRSNIVGKPMAMLLLRENCTVTATHSKTIDLPSITREADILVAAVGIPQFVRGSWVKPGAVVIDVGINYPPVTDSPRITGDVDFDEVSKVAAAISPVPRGVGPMTVACLMQNTIEATCRQRNITFF
jgi:methylenetetrahydrofolate dehydrogenase (NADP+)/methenyltetrahydrofolate cyclohydrolase